MLTTSLSQDLYRRFVNPAASDHRVLWVARWTAVAAGTLGTGLAIVAESIIGVLTIFYTLLTVSLVVPIIEGLYIRRVGTPEVLTSIAAGVGLVVTLELTNGRSGSHRAQAGALRPDGRSAWLRRHPDPTAIGQMATMAVW